MLKKENNDIAKLSNKVVVVDTSALLLAGIEMLDVLPPCRLVIPAVVAKELEDKRSDYRLGFLSRQWMHLLEELRQEYGAKLSAGVKIADKNITIQLEPNHTNQKALPVHLQDGSVDSTVLAVAKNLNKEYKNRVVLLSNDTPMRLHATLELDLPALEFSSYMLKPFEPFTGVKKFIVDSTLETYENVDLDDVPYQAVIFCSPENEPITTSVKIKGTTRKTYHDGCVMFPKHTSIMARSPEQAVAMYYLEATCIPVCSIGGSAGTGKTIITLAVGLDLVKRGDYEQIVVLRSLHEMGQGQDLGFLPGDVADKMAPWGGAVDDALSQIVKKMSRGKNCPEKQVDLLKKLRTAIKVEPITYMRGRNLANCFVVLDEAQNFSRKELLSILTRVGENTKVVLLHDSEQVDNRFLKSGKEAEVLSLVDELKTSDLFAHITLAKTERSKVAELAAGLLSS